MNLSRSLSPNLSLSPSRSVYLSRLSRFRVSNLSREEYVCKGLRERRRGTPGDSFLGLGDLLTQTEYSGQRHYHARNGNDHYSSLDMMVKESRDGVVGNG